MAAMTRRGIPHLRHIRRGGNAKRVKKIKPATLAELEALVTAMPERYRFMALLASWCGMRFGERTELRRGDVNTKAGLSDLTSAKITGVPDWRATGSRSLSRSLRGAGLGGILIGWTMRDRRHL